MAEVLQRPEPGNRGWSLLGRFASLVRRGEQAKPMVPSPEELRRQEREEHIDSWVKELMSHYPGGEHAETLIDTEGKKATLLVYVYSIKDDSPFVPDRPVGYLHLRDMSVDGRERKITWVRDPRWKENPQTLAERGVLYSGDRAPSELVRDHMDKDAVLDAWEKWEPSIRRLIDTRKTQAPSA